MPVSHALDFASELLRKMHVPARIIQRPAPDLDMGLRALLFGDSDRDLPLGGALDNAQQSTVYRFFDEYRCSYVFFRLPESERYFCVGPYLSSLPTSEFIAEKAEQLKLTEEGQKQLAAYYQSLPTVSDESHLTAIMETLGGAVFGGAENVRTELLGGETQDKRHPAYPDELFEVYETPDSFLKLSTIEQNYENERTLMEAVSKGKISWIDMIEGPAPPPTGTTLQGRKNDLIIQNTLLRKAAEYGAVPTVHIHRLCTAFARQIDQLRSIEESHELQKSMIRKYCLLVKEHSLKKYSHIIARTITLISHDLTADLTLKSVANSLNVNASYLSALFKKECGETLTDYVIRKRMESAAFFLRHTEKQIQTIAEQVGVLDVNYFIKLFKRQYGMTPSHYRAHLIK